MAESLALKTKPNIDLMLNPAQSFENASLKLANSKKQDITGANFSSVMNDKMNANAEKIHTNFVDKMAKSDKSSSNGAKKSKNITSLDSKEDFRKNALKEELKNDSKKEVEKKQENNESDSKIKPENKADAETENKTRNDDSIDEVQKDCENKNPEEISNSEPEKKQNDKKDETKSENFGNILNIENFQTKDVLNENQTNNNEENKTSNESQILSNIDYSSFVEPSPVFSSSSAETKERSGNGDFALDESQDLLQNAVERTLKVQKIDSSFQNENNSQNSQNFENLTKENLEEFIKNNKLNPKEQEEILSLFDSINSSDSKLNPELVSKINELIKNSNQKQNSDIEFKGKNENNLDFQKLDLKTDEEISQLKKNASKTAVLDETEFNDFEFENAELENIEFENFEPKSAQLQASQLKNSYNNASEIVARQTFDENALNINNLNLNNNSTELNSAFAESFNSKGIEGLNSAQKSSAGEIFSQKLNQSDILNQITNKLTDSIQTGSKKLTMILRPYDLGRLSIELSTNKDGLTTNIIAQNEDVRNYIEKNINSLRQQLTDAGINVKNIEIKTAGQDGSSKYQGNSENQGNLGDLNQNSNSNKENNSFNQNVKNFQKLSENNEDYQSLVSNFGYELNFAKDFSSVFSKALEYGLN